MIGQVAKMPLMLRRVPSSVENRIGKTPNQQNPESSFAVLCMAYELATAVESGSSDNVDE